MSPPPYFVESKPTVFESKATISVHAKNNIFPSEANGVQNGGTRIVNGRSVIEYI